MFVVNYADARQERARDKARAERPVVEVEALGAYRVEGSAGNFYNVTVALAGGAFEVGCSCMAGQNDKPCYHAFAALRAHEVLAVTAAAPVPARRDARLALVESDLNRIARLAAEMGGDFEIADDIQRAVRAALRSLGEYEVSMVPEAAGRTAAA